MSLCHKVKLGAAHAAMCQTTTKQATLIHVLDNDEPHGAVRGPTRWSIRGDGIHRALHMYMQGCARRGFFRPCRPASTLGADPYLRDSTPRRARCAVRVVLRRFDIQRRGSGVPIARDPSDFRSLNLRGGCTRLAHEIERFGSPSRMKVRTATTGRCP